MEPLKHECGVAMIRLLKPLEYYQQKYGTWMYALNKLYLMMEKQHNRGQEGAGMACVKLGGKPGHEYMFRERAEGKNAVTEIFGKANANFKSLTPEQLADAKFAKEELPLQANFIWDTCATVPPERVAFSMCTHSCDVTIGRRRTSAFVVTST